MTQAPGAARRLAAAALGVLLALGAQLATAEEAAPDALDVESVAAHGVKLLVAAQEGKARDRWPYEGVYRFRGQIPIGYEIGGTALVSLALVETPGYAADAKRKQALQRGLMFVLGACGAPLMESGFLDTYDVRGWGHTYALLLLLRLDELDAVPKKLRPEVKRRTEWLLKTLEATAIPEGGGWNYSRPEGFGSPKNQASPFMTAPTLQALFQARAHGYSVSEDVVERALDALERGRTSSGGITYSAPGTDVSSRTEDELRFMDKLPGSIGRMVVVETTLLAAGRGSQERLRHAVDSFFEHWTQLEVRRQKTGTHIEPYGVAPYYFMYAHYYAAQAIEAITDEDARAGYRARLRATLAGVQELDGSWNDRVFPRSMSYGTALALMALQMESLLGVATWPAPQPKLDPAEWWRQEGRY